MEKKDEFVEMRVRTIDEAMNVDKLIGHLTFDQVMDDEEKMDIMMLDGQNFKLLLEEVNEPHRMMLGIINPDEADLLYTAVNDPEGTDATLPYQTVHILKELGVTVEKVVVKDKVKLLHRAIVTLRKEDGSVMEMQLTLFDALVVSLIAGVPFYVNAKFLEDPRSGFTKSVPNTKALLGLLLLRRRRAAETVIDGQVVSHAADKALVVDKGGQHGQCEKHKADRSGQPEILHPAAHTVTAGQRHQQHVRQRQQIIHCTTRRRQRGCPCYLK